MARGRAWLLLPLSAAAGCAGGDGLGEDREALRVCHDTVVEGIDVAEFDGTVDWPAVHASGRGLAIARIADGAHLDPEFAANWAGIRSAGMIRGAYLFFRPTHTAASQAETILRAVGRLGSGDLPVTLDVECMCSFNSAGVCASSGAGCADAPTAAAVLSELAARVEADTGRVPMIYTSARVWDGPDYLDGAASLPASPLWVAGYENGCVALPSGWTDWQIWQYSDGTCRGCIDMGSNVPGVPSSPGVDRDRFNGTREDLEAFAGISRAMDAGAAVPDAGEDAGLRADAGAGVDAGVGMDAGVGIDAGAGMDAGAEMDAGAGVDAGAGMDAGAEMDAASRPEDAASVDAGKRPAAGKAVPEEGGCGCSSIRDARGSADAIITPSSGAPDRRTLPASGAGPSAAERRVGRGRTKGVAVPPAFKARSGGHPWVPAVWLLAMLAVLAGPARVRRLTDPLISSSSA